MTHAQVAKIVGGPGELMSESRLEAIPDVTSSLTTEMFVWSNDDGSNMNGIFQNDRLLQKAQFNLPTLESELAALKLQLAAAQQLAAEKSASTTTPNWDDDPLAAIRRTQAAVEADAKERAAYQPAPEPPTEDWRAPYERMQQAVEADTLERSGK